MLVPRREANSDSPPGIFEEKLATVQAPLMVVIPSLLPEVEDNLLCPRSLDSIPPKAEMNRIAAVVSLGMIRILVGSIDGWMDEYRNDYICAFEIWKPKTESHFFAPKKSPNVDDSKLK